MSALRRYRQIINWFLVSLLGFWQIGQPLQAATFTWTQTATGTNSWLTTSNWSPVGFPNAIDDVVNLNNAIAGVQTINLDRVIKLGTLNIGDTQATPFGFTLAAGTGGYLMLDVSSGSATINKAAGANANDVISAGLQFNDTLAISNNSTVGSLSLSGALRSLASDITFNGVGGLSTGSIVVTGPISTAGNLVKNDAGITALNAANTYAGSTTINGGSLRITSTTGLPVRSAVTVGTGAALDLNAAFTIGSLAGLGDVTNVLNTARVLTVGRDDTSTTFSGRILPTTAANIAITKIGAGTLLLNPTLASTYTGNTIINGGTINLSFANTSLTSLLAATPLQITGGNFIMTGKAGLAANQLMGALTVGITGGAITLVAGDGSGTTLRTGAVTATANGGTVLITAPTNTAFQMNQSYIAANHNPRLVFSDGTANVFNWALNTGVNTNTTAFTAYTAVPIAGGGANTTAYNLTASQTQNTAAFVGRSVKLGSTLGSTQTWDLAGFNATLGGATTATPGAILIDGTDAWNINTSGGVLRQAHASVSGDLIFHQYSTGTVTVNAGIADNGTVAAATTTLVKAGTGLLVLAGTNTFTGPIIVNDGILSFSNVTAAGAGSLGNGSTTAVTIRDGATLQYTGATGLISGAAATPGAHTYVLQGGNATIDVATAAATDVLTLNGAISGNGGLTKSGIGILALGASATYTGPTFINAGTLRPAGSFAIGSTTSPLTVGASGTLDINGTAGSQTLTIGSLAGAGTVLNSNTTAKTLSVGSDNTSTTFSGTFATGGVASNVLTKVGSGIFTLTNAVTSAWTGGNNVNGGVLSLGASNTLSTSGTTNIGLSTGPAALELGAGFNQTLAAITFYGTGAATTTQGNVIIGSGATLTLGGTITANNTGNPLGAVISGAGTLSMWLTVQRFLPQKLS